MTMWSAPSDGIWTHPDPQEQQQHAAVTSTRRAVQRVLAKAASMQQESHYHQHSYYNSHMLRRELQDDYESYIAASSSYKDDLVKQHPWYTNAMILTLITLLLIVAGYAIHHVLYAAKDCAEADSALPAEWEKDKKDDNDDDDDDDLYAPTTGAITTRDHPHHVERASRRLSPSSMHHTTMQPRPQGNENESTGTGYVQMTEDVVDSSLQRGVMS